MSKQIAKHQQDKQKQHKGRLDGVTEKTGEQVHLTEQIRTLLSSADGSAIQAQAAYLNDVRFGSTQRQEMAAQLGRLGGNQYLQRVMAFVQQKDQVIPEQITDCPANRLSANTTNVSDQQLARRPAYIEEQTSQQFVQRKWRYSTMPPNCPALEKADEVVKGKLKEDGDANPDRKLTMGSKDAKYRVLWMGTYIKHGGKVSRKDPHLPMGALSGYCKEQQKKNIPKQPSATHGYIVVSVVEKSGGATKAVGGANVHILDLLIKQSTNQGGKTRIKVPAGKPYIVSAWKKNYTEWFAKSPTVPVGGETTCKIELHSQKPGTLPVQVMDEKGRSVKGATVYAEPTNKSHGSWKTLTGKTDNLGQCYFENIRWNTYKVSAYKDKAISGTKRGKVSRSGMNRLVKLNINLKAETMSVRVSSARWYKASIPGKLKQIPIPGPGILGLDVYFEIWDHERNKVAKYFGAMTRLGITWGSWWSSGKTTAAGPWTHFNVPRTYQYNEDSFNGAAQVTIYTIGTNMYFDLSFKRLLINLNAYNIAVGKNTDKVPGLDRYSGSLTLTKQ
ncbi:MAG: hypothetical protein GY796_21790 [Chloroflexi bacterium]|nr:hypothetical protein [Chloroflexota bacterium]